MVSMRWEEILVQLELILSVKWAPEWMRGPSVADAPKSIREVPQSSPVSP